MNARKFKKGDRVIIIKDCDCSEDCPLKKGLCVTILGALDTGWDIAIEGDKNNPYDISKDSLVPDIQFARILYGQN